MEYRFNKYDFKRYLLENMPGARIDELIFWKNNIPVPLDLVYRIFEERNALVRLYLDHLSAILFYWKSQTNEDVAIGIASQPCKKKDDEVGGISNILARYFEDQEIRGTINNIREVLGQSSYKPELEGILKALRHDGKKYKRIYFPLSVKKKLVEYSPELVKVVGVSNNDMFGNVVADHLKIYRSGFSDGFYSIFNKLLDFQILFQTEGSLEEVKNTEMSMDLPDLGCDIPKNASILFNEEDSTVAWEPIYDQNRIKSQLCLKHDFISHYKNDPEALNAIAQLAQAYSEIEMKTFKKKDKRFMEDIRSDISRQLRIYVEELMG
ncbi:hypothetical protein [Sediminitomix flava]|uniref:Uncharacterized protein n=1 Tax=Sediminitomix flava TaxID=379075 RepID=A0A315ZCW2_SEDFL|nr:hypothetical protein [Sediminitomix flava]PWJ42668.1 hypothetical protein BC781_102213 [Sediminitomix flava]